MPNQAALQNEDWERPDQTLSFHFVETRRVGATQFIHLQGEIGIAATGELRAALEKVEKSPASLIVLDIDGAQALCASALRAILEASRRSKRDGNRLRITRGRGHVADLLRLTALDHSLQFLDFGPPRPIGPDASEQLPLGASSRSASN